MLSTSLFRGLQQNKKQLTVIWNGIHSVHNITPTWTCFNHQWFSYQGEECCGEVNRPIFCYWHVHPHQFLKNQTEHYALNMTGRVWSIAWKDRYGGRGDRLGFPWVRATLDSGWCRGWQRKWWMDNITVDIPASARTAHKGLLQKRLEEDLYWIIPHVTPNNHINQGTELNLWVLSFAPQSLTGDGSSPGTLKCPSYQPSNITYPVRQSVWAFSPKANWRLHIPQQLVHVCVVNSTPETSLEKALLKQTLIRQSKHSVTSILDNTSYWWDLYAFTHSK